MENIKLVRGDVEDILPLTPYQEGILFKYPADPHSTEHCVGLSIPLTGIIKNEFAKMAWNAATESNEMLRSVFRWKKNKNPIRIILT